MANHQYTRPPGRVPAARSEQERRLRNEVFARLVARHQPIEPARVAARVAELLDKAAEGQMPALFYARLPALGV
jgi:hypothetical protein